MRGLLGKLFSMSHRLSSVATAILLLWHVWTVGSVKSRALVGFSCLIWLASTFSRLHGLLFHRLTGTMDRVETSGSLGLVKVDVSLNTPTRIKPGKYFNVFFPGNRQHGYPAVVYWPSSSESASRPVDNISFLMSSRARWPIEQLQEKKKLILDGPYGQDLNLQLYENVFLAA